MKAKLNLTGEILDVRKHGDYYIDNDGCVMLPEDLTFIPEPDWQQVHIDAAIAALNGLTSNPSFEGHTLEDVIAECVTIADALIAELQKKDDNANV